MKTKRTQPLDKEQIIAFLRKNKKFLEREFGVTKIALFGSYARDEQKKTSDIDFLIEAKEHDFFNRCALQEFLEENFKKKVDIGYFGSVRTFIMRSINEDLTYAYCFMQAAKVLKKMISKQHGQG